MEEPQFDDMTMLELHQNMPDIQEGIAVKPDQESVAIVSAYIESRLEEAGIGMREISKINIAVDELYSNIVCYSGATRAEAVCRVSDESITVILRDNGTPFDPLQKEDPDTTLPAEERDIGGLGILMTKKLMSDIQYVYENSMNTVTFRLDRAGTSAKAGAM